MPTQPLPLPLNPAPQSNCINCGRPFVVPKSAPHKRFCSLTCRNQHHYHNNTVRRRLKLRLTHNSDTQDTNKDTTNAP